MIAIQRIRDLHNPVLANANKDDKTDDLKRRFDKFALSLLLAYLDRTESLWLENTQTEVPVASLLLHL